MSFSASTFWPLREGCGKEKPTVFNSSGSSIRSIFSKYNGNMAESGSVSFLFDKKGLISIKKEAVGEDELMGLVLDAGAEDLKTEKPDLYEVITGPETFDVVKKALDDKKIPTESAEVTMLPKTTVVLDEKKAESVLKLYDMLDDYEDVQNVHANFEVSDEIMAKIER